MLLKSMIKNLLNIIELLEEILFLVSGINLTILC
jgi:hypothetical protein